MISERKIVAANFLMLCIANTTQAVEDDQYNFCIINQQLSQVSEESTISYEYLPDFVYHSVNHTKSI